jgi:hypothetical protein
MAVAIKPFSPRPSRLVIRSKTHNPLMKNREMQPSGNWLYSIVRPNYVTSWLRLPTDWKNSKETGLGSTASASMINGEYASNGRKMDRMRSKLPIITKETGTW